MRGGPGGPGRVFLEALRLDLEALDDVRRRADAALLLDVGGFILFGGDETVAARLVEELRGHVTRRLWIAADLERGAGQQFAGLTTLPPSAGLAAHPEAVNAVREAGRCTGREARAVGVNLVLAPVLDLDIQAWNPIVGTRSFGPDPERVSELGTGWIAACQAEGVAACAKHFPGHGRTTSDSHAELPVVGATREELAGDVYPFRAVAGDVAAMLTAHVSYPAMGGDRPATLEPAILSGLLREELCFEGLVVTDALNMGAVQKSFVGMRGSPDPAVAALRAGCDLLLYPSDLGAAVEAVERAADASEEITRRLDEALARSDRVAERFSGARARRRATASVLAADAAAALALAVECVQEVGPVPTWLSPREPVSVTAIWDDREEPYRQPLGTAFRSELTAAGWRVTLPTPAPSPATASILLVASTPQAWKGTAWLTGTGRAAVEGALSRERTYPVILGHRRLLESFGLPGACAWGTEPQMERAAARKLHELVRRRGATA